MTNQSQLIKYLDAQTRAIVTLLPKASRHLAGESVHKLRVATRRVRAAIWVLKHSSSEIHLNKLDHILHKLGHALGKVRELDVAIMDASRFGVDSTQLKKDRKNIQRKLRKLLSRDERAYLRKLLLIAKEKMKVKEPILLTVARKNLRIRLNEQLKRNIHGQTKFHQLRIVMKKVRYALEAMGSPTEALKLLQDILGEAHDLEFLQTLIGKNSKIKAEQHLLNDKAVHLVQPTLHFAFKQLAGNLCH